MRIVRHRLVGGSTAGGRNHLLEMHLNNVAAGNIAGEAAYLPAANADEAAPRERQEAPRQPDILLVEHPEHQQPADPPSRIVQISLDAMRLFLSVNAMPLRVLRRRQGITSVEMIMRIDALPDVVFCGIVITGDSEDSVMRAAEDIEDSGWSDYQANGREVYGRQVTTSQDEHMSTP